MHNDYSFKSKGNSLQFKFNAGLQDDIEDILDDQNLKGSTVEALNVIVSKISKRHKMIKIADCSPSRWATITKYEDEPFDSDSEASKKIRQAENRALAKNKNKSPFTSSSKPDHTRRPQFQNDSFQHGFNSPPPPFPFFFSPFKPENPTFTQSQEKIPKPTDTCYGAGKQDTGAVDALKRTKTEIDAEGKFNFNYVCSEDDLMVNKEIFDHENSKKSNISLKGNLKRNIAYWQNTLMADESVLCIIENGYKIPFFETPEKAHLPNNKSSLKNEKFVLDSISEMLKIGSIKEVKAPPKVINLLSVSKNSAGKKRLILDLIYISEDLYKDKIKLDDWKCFENYLEHTDGYAFKFDLKSDYHHVGMFEEHHTYLDFLWKINNILKFFVFTVLPFGLLTATFVFTKVVRTLVKYRRFNSIKIA